MLGNYLRGRGKTLVPMFSPDVSIPAGSTYTFQFRVKTSVVARLRVWQIFHWNSSASRPGLIQVRAPASSGTAKLSPVGPARGVYGSYTEYVESFTGSGTESTISLEITVNSPDAVNIYGISCVELPRGELALDSSDLGIDVNTEAAREPIINEGNRAIAGVAAVLGDTENGRRGGLVYWATDTTAALVESAGVNTRFIGGSAGLDVSILGRRIGFADTTATASWRVYCKTANAGDTGQVVVINTNTAAATAINIPINSNAAFAWFPSTAGAPSTFSIDCEDAASTDGRQTSGSPAWNDFTFVFRRTGGTSLSIAGLSVWED